ncbi:aminopeptidase [Desulfotomaculum copahuensis]|uniref:M18 family aminopeptidase n=1 Tax=Desulfotomaculum copahuensis TaxID=1838280 RepID=A0A1B7LAW2_9FIRM|nr:aminopeptidase [Desulfotomaculum copahuensis]OAT79469.1 aminopeptidase [Desulfotomaculum copahuensis]
MDDLKTAGAWERMDDGMRQAAYAFAGAYRQFISMAKTERETVQWAAGFARNNGFAALEERPRLNPGDRIFSVVRGKAMLLAVVGSEPLEKGLNIVGAHVDAPRLDLKPRPLYEENGLALLKTHYYGGIKKYQWVSMPLALHGVVVRGDGQVLPLVIGENEQDPVFTITDLLPHLAKDQMEKKMSEAIKGEALNLLVGGIPVTAAEVKEKVKQAVLDQLQRDYGLTEEDLISAELEAVPAWPARDVGLDRSMIGAYGQDDRVCAYTALQAVAGLPAAGRTAVVLLADKEEIGSVGNTGMHSAMLANFVAELAGRTQPQYSDLVLRRALYNSRALSADVDGALDPNYPDVSDKLNVSRPGHGVVLNKYTGSRGKSGANDAHAEYMGFVRRLFNQAGVIWQTGELGKVDQGGGGTIAYMLADYGMDVLDCGVGLLGMHSPFEVASKADIYMAYRAYLAFLGA